MDIYELPLNLGIFISVLSLWRVGSLTLSFSRTAVNKPWSTGQIKSTAYYYK